MGKDDDWRRGVPAGKIVPEPGQLRRAEIAHSPRLQVRDVYERDKVHAAMVKAVPARAEAVLAEAVQERLPAVWIQHVMLARNEENRKASLVQYLSGIVEFFVAGKL